VWKSLTDAQRKVLTDAAIWLENLDATESAELVKAERERQQKFGIEALDFGPQASQDFLKKAYDVAWQTVIAKSPEVGKKLRELAGN
jgi:TRAP-type C4-dicarboxylate transport system substrate-binding protein